MPRASGKLDLGDVPQVGTGHADAAAGHAGRGDGLFVGFGGQPLAQRGVPVTVDVDPVSLRAGVDGGIALEEQDVVAVLAQAVGETGTGQAGAADQDTHGELPLRSSHVRPSQMLARRPWELHRSIRPSVLRAALTVNPARLLNWSPGRRAASGPQLSA